MDITWYGNASVRIRIDGLSLLFDPFLPLPGAAYSLSADQLLPAPNILITHGHLDHLASVPELVSLGAGMVYATSRPCQTLEQQAVPAAVLHQISPGDKLRFEISGDLGDGTDDAVTVSVLPGKHIVFDTLLVLRTLLNPRVLRFMHNVPGIIRTNRAFTESHETVHYEIAYAGQRIMLMGSLGLADEEVYEQGVDLLVLPYQGHTHLERLALPVVERLMPRRVLLDHFDDAFPPVSRSIDTSGFVSLMARLHPDIECIVPQRFAVMEL